MKVENEMALPITKSVTVMLLEPYAGKLARTVLRGESSRKGADLLDNGRTSRSDNIKLYGQGGYVSLILAKTSTGYFLMGSNNLTDF